MKRKFVHKSLVCAFLLDIFIAIFRYYANENNLVKLERSNEIHPINEMIYAHQK